MLTFIRACIHGEWDCGVDPRCALAADHFYYDGDHYSIQIGPFWVALSY